jgi:hypothetical protein
MRSVICVSSSSSFIVFNRGGRGRARNVVEVVVLVLHRLRSFIIIYLSVDSSLTTWLCLRQRETRKMSLRTKLVYFDLVPSGTSKSPWIVHHRSKDTRERKPSGLDSIRFPVLGCRFLNADCHIGYFETLFHMSFPSPFASISPLGVGVGRLNCCLNYSCTLARGDPLVLDSLRLAGLSPLVRCRAVLLSRTCGGKIFLLS